MRKCRFRNRFCVPLGLCLGWILLLLCGCDGDVPDTGVIYSGSGFVVGGDSVVQGDSVAIALSPFEIRSSVEGGGLSAGRVWSQSVLNEDFPRFHSSQLLIDALYNLGIDDIAHNYSSAGGFNTYGNHDALYGSVLLCLSLLDPVAAEQTLRLSVSDDEVVQGEGTWPVCSDRLGWVAAAWEVYCATGDSTWLDYAYRVSLNTIDSELLAQRGADDGLLHGILLGRFHEGEFFPSWAGATDLAEVETLYNNVMAIRAMDLANEMAYELDEPVPYEQEALHLREAVNQHFWFESHGRYTAYRLGVAHRMPTPLTDNVAQSLATIWGIADDDRSLNLIERSPLCPYGVSPYYPVDPSTELYLSFPSWGLVQALWTLGAGSVGNEAGVRAGLGALMRGLAFYQPRHYFRGETRLNDLANASAMPAMVLRLLAGVRLLPDGIEFDPYVPSCLPGVKTILGLNYRGAQLDITLTGTGNRIERLLLDGEPIEGGFISADLEGHHNVLIELGQGREAGEAITVSGRNKCLSPSPEVLWHNGYVHVTNWHVGTSYKLMINGELGYSFSDSVFSVSSASRQAELAVVSVGRYERSLPSRTTLVGAKPPVVVRLPECPTLPDTLTVTASTERAGTYVLQATYRCEGGCPVVLVEANGHRQGCLVLPATAAPAQTNRIAVRLLRGENRLRLIRLDGTPDAAGITRLSLYATQ